MKTLKKDKSKKPTLASKKSRKPDKAVRKTTKKPKLYALLVGIGDYKDQIILNREVTFPKLRGPINDVTKIKGLLEGESHYSPEIRVLNDKSATKGNIISGFTDHLAKAGEGDVAFFYFSGHGTQEYTLGLFSSETDGKLECIVAWFDESNKHNCLVADKELRWLITSVAKNKPHIITIFDCCHSTDITRNGGMVAHAFDGAIEKRVAYVFPQRLWKNFVFSNVIQEDEMVRRGDAKLLPESPHVSLTACESNESAIEIAGEGVFTKVLVNVLRKSNGNISYENLAGRVRLLMKDVYEQKPWAYAPPNKKKLLLSRFLGKPMDSGVHVVGEMVYKSSGEWLINLGAIHGLILGNEIEILDPLTFKTVGKVDLKEVFVSTSRVSPKQRLDDTLTYPIATAKLLNKPLKIYLAPSASLPVDHQKMTERIASALVHSISLTDSEETADYCLRFTNGLYYITKPKSVYVPVVQPVSVDDENFVELILAFLDHISKWEFFKSLDNSSKATRLDNTAIGIEATVLSGEGRTTTLKDGDKLRIKYFLRNNSWSNVVTIKLRNKTKKDLYVCAQYLSTTYQAFTNWLNPPVYLLETGTSVNMQFYEEGRDPVKEIPVYLDPLMTLLNLKQLTDQINFIYSEEKFESTMLDLPELPMLLNGRSRSGFGIPVGKKESKELRKWGVRHFQLELLNPMYNTANNDQLGEWLEDESIADFVAGTYFDVVPNGIDFKLVLKPAIELTSDRKGFVRDKILDLANWWARHGRNRYFSKISEKYHDRVKIVAEGDSWFQHPLVLDIIDHLSKLYSIYCVSAAGDTLLNYLSQQKKNGEYFLDAIRDHQPTIFLISGGGNDILGVQFREYLVDNPDLSLAVGQNPRRFLKPSMFAKINDLMITYKTILRHLEVHFPQLFVIMHGYDYPIRLNDANKGWLGRYMIEKGIKRQGDRAAIIHLIMDTFNEELKKIAYDSKNATYIDARNIVREDQWYDEIHPDNNGFQLVAMKFMEKIDLIVASSKTVGA